MKMKNKSLSFSVASAVLIIAFLVLVNWLTSWSHPWFIYPAFAVLWWPLGIYAANHKGKYVMPLAGTTLIAGFMILVNTVTSPQFPWAGFPIFAVLWWPLAQILCGEKRYRLFSIVGALWTIAFFVWLNLTTSPQFLWLIYPAFAVLWWPLSLIICGEKRYKLFSIIGALYLMVFFALINWQTSPHTLWFVYPAYAVLWWPLSMFLAKKKTMTLYAVLMSALTVILLAVINLIYTPQTVWFPWTVFYFIWWPLCQALGRKAGSVAFAVIGAVAIIGYHVFVYFMLTPEVHPWYLYLIPPAVWWPVTLALKEKAKSLAFLFGSMVVFLIYYGAINILLSPGYFWSIYLLYAFAWGVIGAYFGTRKQYFALSIWGTVITIIFFAVLNYITTPHHIWAVYPTFAILFWPLSIYFFKVKGKDIQKSA